VQEDKATFTVAATKCALSRDECQPKCKDKQCMSECSGAYQDTTLVDVVGQFIEFVAPPARRSCRPPGAKG
jgi:hypothetical protein